MYASKKRRQSVSTRPKKQDRAIATRKHLTDAARQVFARDGFELARVEDIAAAAGKTRGAFYANFKDKEDIFFAIFEENLARDREQVSLHLNEEMCIRDRSGSLRWRSGGRGEELPAPARPRRGRTNRRPNACRPQRSSEPPRPTNAMDPGALALAAGHLSKSAHRGEHSLSLIHISSSRRGVEVSKRSLSREPHAGQPGDDGLSRGLVATSPIHMEGA